MADSIAIPTQIPCESKGEHTVKRLTPAQHRAIEIANYYFSLMQYHKAVRKGLRFPAVYWGKSLTRSEALLLG